MNPQRIPDHDVKLESSVKHVEDLLKENDHSTGGKMLETDSSIMDLPAGCTDMEARGPPGGPPCRMCLPADVPMWRRGVYQVTTARKRAECVQNKNNSKRSIAKVGRHQGYHGY